MLERVKGNNHFDGTFDNTVFRFEMAAKSKDLTHGFYDVPAGHCTHVISGLEPGKEYKITFSDKDDVITCTANENGEISFTCHCDDHCRVVVDLVDKKDDELGFNAKRAAERTEAMNADKPKIGPRNTKNLVGPEELKRLD